MSTPVRRPVYDLDALAEKYPSLKTLVAPPGEASPGAWVAAFTLRPEALESMLADLIKQTYAQPGRIGQRPMPREEEVNLDTLLNGDYTEEPLTEVLPKFVRNTTHQAFAAKILMSKRTYQRIFLPDSHKDKYWPKMDEIERIAAAVGKPPSYFLEYRLMAAQAAFLRLITDRPALATRLYREYLQVSKRSPFLR